MAQVLCSEPSPSFVDEMCDSWSIGEACNETYILFTTHLNISKAVHTESCLHLPIDEVSFIAHPRKIDDFAIEFLVDCLILTEMNRNVVQLERFSRNFRQLCQVVSSLNEKKMVNRSYARHCQAAKKTSPEGKYLIRLRLSIEGMRSSTLLL